jgi:hypothetical protein
MDQRTYENRCKVVETLKIMSAIVVILVALHLVTVAIGM